ncbi:MAG: hypothetical protein KDE35_09130 [Geminicoccaceae bacterium]|nr:hypothetical protein [Geminicoccaceae bacterium]
MIEPEQETADDPGVAHPPVAGATSGDPLPGCWFAAHELRTPLHAIASTTELLLDGSMGALSTPVREALDLIAAATHQLGERCERLAQWHAAGERAGAIVPVETADLLERLALRPTRDVRSVSNGRVLADPGLLHEALMLARASVGRDTTTIEAAVASDPGRLTLQLALDMSRLQSGEGQILFETARQLGARSGCALRIGDRRRLELSFRSPA